MALVGGKKSCTRICISRLERKTAVFERMNESIYALSATVPRYTHMLRYTIFVQPLFFFLLSPLHKSPYHSKIIIHVLVAKNQNAILK